MFFGFDEKLVDGGYEGIFGVGVETEVFPFELGMFLACEDGVDERSK